MGLIAMDKGAVGLIADVKQPPACTKGINPRQHPLGNHHPTGVIRRHGDDGPGAGRDRCLQALQVRNQPRIHGHRQASRQLDRHHVVEVVGERQDHLSGFGCSAPTDHLGNRRKGHVAAGRDPQRGARQIEIVVRDEMALDGFQQRGLPLHRSIAMQARSRLLDRLRQGG